MGRVPNDGERGQRGAASAGYGVRLGAFYGALFLILGVHLPYLPVWLNGRGLSAEQIAIVTAAPLFLRVFITPTVAMLADHTGAHRRLINGLAWLALVLALLLAQAHGFWAIFLLAVPLAIAFSTIIPLTETVAVAGVRAHGLDYGHMRLWGSITFVAAGFVGGWLIDRAGAGVVIGCIVAGAVATVAFAWLLPERVSAAAASGGEGQGSIPSRHAADVRDSPPSDLPHKGGGTRGAQGSIAEVRGLVGSPVFLAFLLAAGAVQGAHGMFYTFGALAWQAQGISTAWVGALWGVAIAGEVALFAYSGSVVRRWGPVTLLVAAAVAAVARWGLMSLSPPLAVLVPLQLLHMLTYSASHLAAMHFISRAVPERAQGTAQALYATVAAGVLLGGATLLSGWLYAWVGGHAYLAMAVLAAIGLAAALVVRARWHGGLLWDGGSTKPAR
ncbi:MFS transporter [Hyphomicrobium sp.]|uniref:MFS transporter n=1 Tax=Hyphomicrobium sp. TaxID=82 RepID=UPI0025B9CF7D|nr:MFS transporter [Hyphomicrobium sp.]MCC7250755.1 MFS transporter [Hyphomicrobium sp.]